MSIHYYLYCQCSHPPWSLAWTTIIASKLASLHIIHSAHSRQRDLQRRGGGAGRKEGNLIMSFTSLCLQRTKSSIWPKRTCMVWPLPTSSASSFSVWFPALSALSTTGHRSLFQNIPCSDCPRKAYYQITWTPPTHPLYLSLSSTFSEKPANNSSDRVSWVPSKIALNGTYFGYSDSYVFTHSVQGWSVWPSEGRRSDGMCHLQIRL